MTTLELARAYVAAGLSVIPIRSDGSKAPALGSWKKFQLGSPLPYDLQQWFAAGSHGLAVLGGAVSGGLEILDFEAPEVYLAWRELVEAETAVLLCRLPTVRTPRGYHVYFRCPGHIQGNHKLARAVDAHGEVLTVIETRGEGGYVLAPGCPPACHPTGRRYELLPGPDLAAIPEVSADERELLLTSARALNRYAEPAASWDQPAAVGQLRPGDDYERRTAWAALLEPAGWVRVREHGGLTFWRRPGKDHGWSATTGMRSDCSRDLLYVFTSNAHPFQSERSYSKFAAFAVLHHSSDYQAAARALGDRGYGQSRNGRAREPHAKSQGSGGAGESEDSPAPPEPWDTPIPLNELPQAARFPVDVFPPELAQYAHEAAWATGSPPDYVALPMLAVAAGAIGNSRRLAITRTHYQSACLYVAVVGPPGSGKSPALELVTEPVHKAERRHYQIWRAHLRAWEDSGQETGRPVLHRCLVDDVTTEAMMRILQDNPRGLTMVRDELAALVTGMNQYRDSGKGADRQVFLKIWPGASISVDRRSNENGVPVKVIHPFVAIVGGIQPAVIDWMRGEQRGNRPPPDDGFLDRFLVGYPDPLPATAEQWRDVSPASAEAWDQTVRTLLDLNMTRNEEEEERPLLVHLDHSGQQAWERFTQRHADQLNGEEFPEHLRGAWAKLRGYCGRLALVLHCLRQACQPGLPSALNSDSVSGAERLVEYFKLHALRLHAAMGSDPRVAAAAAILKWLTQRPDVTVFSKRDVYRTLLRTFRDPDLLDAPLELLCDHHYLRPLNEERAGPGRRASHKFLVSPLWERSVVDRIDRIQESGPENGNSVNSVNNAALWRSELE